MIDHSDEGRGLWVDQAAQDARMPPFMVVRCIVKGDCGCRVVCGMLVHNQEPGVSWFPCEAHETDKPDNPQVRFRDSLTDNPMALPVEEVIEGYLQPEYDWSPGDVVWGKPDGTIVLDDGITTFNPVRARVWMAAHGRG